MTLQITATITKNTIYVTVPFIIKDDFKRFFNPLRFNFTKKVWEIKNNEESLNKVKQFNTFHITRRINIITNIIF